MDTSVVLLQAPAGYGKTTVLSQWDSADPRPFAWITVDDRDDDPGLLLESISTALDQIEPVDNGVFAAVRAPGPKLSSVVVPRICDAVRKRKRSFVLVLDDLHRVEDADSLGAIAAIAESVPPGSTLAIASREEPAISLGHLRAARPLLELHAEDLSMSRPEASELVDQAGLSLSAEGVARLVEHTEGWPVGLYLATLSVGQGKEPDSSVRHMLGDHRLVADYLREEFLAGRPAAAVDFLIRTSILDRLSGPLCDAVLDQEGSAETLKELARSNQLVVALDQRDREYRYHALLREMLEGELHRAGEKQEAELHARASHWFLEHGDVDRAVDHAIAEGDREAAGTLIWSVTPTYAANGRLATVRRWLDRFSEEEVAASAPLCLTLAASEMTFGNGSRAEHWTEVALEALAAAPQEGSDLLEDAARLIRITCAARDGVVRMGEDAVELNSRLPEEGPYRSICFFVEGVSQHLRGNREAAHKSLLEGARRGEASARNVRVLCIAQLSLLELDDEGLDEAGVLMEGAVSELSHFGLEDYPTLALVSAAAALVDAFLGRAEDATAMVRRAEGHLAGLDLSDWYLAEAHIVLARALLRLDDVAVARAHLARAGHSMADAADAAVLRDWLEQAWRDADAAAAMTGRWPLTPAELRLLHALPTHLSFPEIAEQFFVSANTVKTQARSIYKKFGVASRTEAVDCARGAGLLPADDPESSTLGESR